MKQFYHWTGNWGWAIVCLAASLKLCLYSLSAREVRTSFAMRKLQPRIDILKLRYGNDQQKIGKATLELYRRERINVRKFPLPGLLQIPIQMAFYQIIPGSIEFRHAPFIFWIKDLSAVDPYYGLPILFGFTVFIDQFIERQVLPLQAKDPTQASTALVGPVLVTILFSVLQFPAGFILYLLAQNVFSNLQKWWLLGMPGLPDISRVHSRG
jgi:YidC/Oxa1 family membrane protein insertase